MSTKTSDERKDELQTRLDRKKEIKEDIRKQRDELDALLKTMTEAEQKLLDSSSNASKETRGMETPSLTLKETVRSYELAIKHFSDQYEENEKEIEALKKL
ncbi:hypothetical protein F4778DRAFT_778277 [Xylariomycetidae sp. FL2044]|nr:hypothetical protein F4778DRAFT_778277 [Xylariomycetidae sp. FL2044]